MKTTYPIGVILPTYNRVEALEQCLLHLEEQKGVSFEVVVVDDGSRDRTRVFLKEYQQRAPYAFRWMSQENAGPARARNLAISMLDSTVCLMLGDDIFASPELVASHLKLHEEHPENSAAALGLTRWSEEGQRVTRFMRWLDEGGMQFSYQDLLRGDHADWKHFYTSNLSLKTELLRKHPFHVGFRKAAMEDIELGFRLQRLAGLKMFFLPEALAWHLHPTSFRQACHRMTGVGAASRLFHQLWPEVMQPRPAGKPLKRFVRRQILTNRLPMSVITSVADLCTRVHCPNWIMLRALGLHHSLGYEQAACAEDSDRGLPTSPPESEGRDIKVREQRTEARRK